VIRRPCSHASRLPTAMRASSARRKAPAKPRRRARSRRPGRSSLIGATISRRMASRAASFGFGPSPAFLASLSSPAKVSVTTAVGVGGGAAGKIVQIADRRDPQAQRVGGERLRGRRAVALRREEGRDIFGPSGEGGEVVDRAPGAPGAHGGAIGAARVVGLGVAGHGLGRPPRRRLVPSAAGMAPSIAASNQVATAAGGAPTGAVGPAARSDDAPPGSSGDAAAAGSGRGALNGRSGRLASGASQGAGGSTIAIESTQIPYARQT
jgi:hypothetical protein